MIRGNNTNLIRENFGRTGNYVLLTGAEYSGWMARHSEVNAHREECLDVDAASHGLREAVRRLPIMMMQNSADVRSVLTYLNIPYSELYLNGIVANAEEYDEIEALLVEVEDAVADCLEPESPSAPAVSSVRRINPLPLNLIGSLRRGMTFDEPSKDDPRDTDGDGGATLGDDPKDLGDDTSLAPSDNDDEPLHRDPGVYDVDAGSEASSGWGVGTIAALALGGLAIGLGAAYLKKKKGGSKKGNRR